MSRPKIKDWTRVNFTLDVQTRRDLERLARETQTSMSHVIDVLVREELARRQQTSTGRKTIKFPNDLP